jgi:hypothetical protein
MAFFLFNKENAQSIITSHNREWRVLILEAGLEPAIPSLGGRCLIHEATRDIQSMLYPVVEVLSRVITKKKCVIQALHTACNASAPNSYTRTASRLLHVSSLFAHSGIACLCKLLRTHLQFKRIGPYTTTQHYALG